MRIKVARRGVNRFGMRKYSSVPSESMKGQRYIVGKVRVRGTRTYRYVCSCPQYMYWGRSSCKHIQAFREQEQVRVS